MIRLGIGSWTLPWAVGFKNNHYQYPRWSANDLLHFAADQGVSLLQLYNNIHLTSLTSRQLSQIAGKASRLGIELAVGGEGIGLNELQALLRVASELGSRSVRTVIPAQSGFTSRASELADVTRQFSERMPAFEKSGVLLYLENHDRFSSLEYLQIIRSVDSDKLAVCFDTGNGAGRLEDFMHGFETLREYIHCVHYKEISIRRVSTNLGFIIEGCRPGEGENILSGLFHLLSGCPHVTEIVLEQWVPFQKTIKNTLVVEKEWALEGLRLIKDHLALLK